MMLTHSLSSSLAFGLPGGPEWIVLLVLGLLIFGRRLPEVGKSLGRGIVEFKRGVKGIEDEIDDASSKSEAPRLSERDPASLPRPTAPSETSATPPPMGAEGEKPYTSAPEQPRTE